MSAAPTEQEHSLRKAGGRSGDEGGRLPHSRRYALHHGVEKAYSISTVGVAAARTPWLFSGTITLADAKPFSANRQRRPTEASNMSLRSIWKKNGTAIGSAGAENSCRPRKTRAAVSGPPTRAVDPSTQRKTLRETSAAFRPGAQCAEQVLAPPSPPAPGQATAQGHPTGLSQATEEITVHGGEPAPAAQGRRGGRSPGRVGEGARNFHREAPIRRRHETAGMGELAKP